MSEHGSQIEMPRMVETGMEHFIGRNWVLPRVLDWLEKTEDSTFVLTGRPGSGKTSLTAWIAGSQIAGQSENDSVLNQLRSYVRAVHYCMAQKSSSFPRAFAQSLAEQLMRNVEGFSDELKASMDDGIHIVVNQHVGEAHSEAHVTGLKLDLGNLSESSSVNRILREPLHRLYARESSDLILILIDALDESGDLEQPAGLVSILSKLDLPKNVRLLVTTRPDRRILKHERFNSAPKLDLIADDPSGDADLRAYIHHRLPLLKSDDSRNKLADEITAAADSNFLYARLVLDDISSRSDLKDLSDIRLPKGLSGVYSAFLNRELGAWFEYEPLLGLIAIARGDGFNRKQLESIVGRGLMHELRKCHQYLSGDLPDGPFRLFHKSFSDYLLEDSTNIDYKIDASTALRRLIDFYRKGASSWQEVDWTRVDDYGLLQLASHLFDLRDEQDYRRQLYDLLCGSFMLEKQRRYGSHQYFANDLYLAVDAARSEQPRNLLEEIRANFIYSQLGSMATMVKPGVLGALAGLGQIERALGHAALIQEAKVQCKAYCAIAKEMILQQRSTEIRSVLRYALTAAENISVSISYSDHLEGLWDVLETMAEAGDNEGLESIAATVEEIYPVAERTQVFARLAAAFVRAGLRSRRDEMTQCARDSMMLIAEAELRNTLGKVALSLAEAADHDGVELVLLKAQTLELEGFRRDVMHSTARALVAVGQPEKAFAIVDELFASAFTLDENNGRIWGLEAAARSFLDLGDKEKAREACKSMIEAIMNGPHSESNLSSLSRFADVLLAVQDETLIAQATKTSLKIAMESKRKHRFAKSYAIQTLANLCAKDALQEVLNNPSAFGDDESDQLALAVGLARTGDSESALKIAEGMESGVYKSSVVAEVVKTLMDQGAYETAFTTAQGIEEINKKNNVLSEMAADLKRFQQEELARKVAELALFEARNATRSWSNRRTALGRIALALSKIGRLKEATPVADRAFEEFKTVREESITWKDVLHPMQALIQVHRLEQALELSEKNYNAQLHAEVVQSLMAVGESALARRRAEKVSSWITRKGNSVKYPDLEVGTLVAASLALNAVGEFFRAKELALRAFELVCTLDARSYLLKGVTQALAKAGEMNAAREAASRCLDSAIKTQKDYEGLGITLVGAEQTANAVEALVHAGDLDSAMDAASDLLSKAEHTGNNSYICAAGRAYAALGQVDGIIRAWEVARGLQGNVPLREGTMIMLTQSFSQVGDMKHALSCMLAAQESDQTMTAKFIWDSIGIGAEAIAAIDEGKTLWRIYEAIMEADEWFR